MKTVNILAKHLHQWPFSMIRLTQSRDGVFHGTPYGEEYSTSIFSPAHLVGVAVADDAGISVTESDWLAAKAESATDTTCNISNTTTEEEQRFNAKLQCLDKAILQTSAFSKPAAEGLAEAINAGFDKISKPFIMPSEPVKVIEKDLFIAAVEPLMKYLSENHHPHTSVIVNSITSELVTGEMVHNTDRYLRD
ncbi:hypothetical protein ACG1VR_10455 [Cedecea davisae]|uniref:hypothetical protein n=1 Tax=Cedecea davisae TaxID=158484 RepID=UPI00376EAB81